MFERTTDIYVNQNPTTIEDLTTLDFASHVLVQALHHSGSPNVSSFAETPRAAQYRHLVLGNYPLTTGPGTTLTVSAKNTKTVMLTCSSNHRIWIENRETWVPISQIPVGAQIFVLVAPYNPSNYIANVVSVAPVASFGGYDLFVENEANIQLAVYANGILTCIPW